MNQPEHFVAGFLVGLPLFVFYSPVAWLFCIAFSLFPDFVGKRIGNRKLAHNYLIVILFGVAMVVVSVPAMIGTIIGGLLHLVLDATKLEILNNRR